MTMPIIGKAKFHNFAAYIAWHKTLTREHAQQLWQHTVYAKQDQLGRAYDNVYANFNGSVGFDSANQHRREKLIKFEDYLELTEQPWDVRYVDVEKNLMVISYGQCDENTKSKENQFLIENWPEFIDYTPFADYSAISMQQLKQLTMIGGDGIFGESSLIPQNAGVNLSVADVHFGLSQKEKELEVLRAMVKAVEDGTTEELLPIKKKLEELQEQMKALQEKKLTELSALRAEMEAKKREMEKQLFVLESEIYSIRCFLGETVQFVRLRSGRNAPLDIPVVLYQKVRFMVEDLHKFAIMWPDERICKSVEESLKTSDRLLEAFAPAIKCITLIRYSETGKVYRMHEEELNCLDTYELMHGNQLAILIRNGENLYIGWTDEDKIRLRDDFFLRPTEAKIEAMPERRPNESDSDYQYRMERYEQDMEQENKKALKEGLSRYFLFSILNGVSATEDSILPLPEFRNKTEQAQHILFSMADGTLTDNRFGSFGDIVDRCNAVVRKGDMVLTTMSLRAEKPYWAKGYTTWHNDRGRGDRNRTHDVACHDCTIYPINLVEFDKPEKKVRYCMTYTSVELVNGEYKNVERKVVYTADADAKLADSVEILEYFDHVEQHNFISLQKEGHWWDDEVGPSYANFEINTDEFINLTYMNSVWLNYALSTRDMSGWRAGGSSVNYEYALRYIGKALAFIREREEAEAENIRLANGETILANPDWPVMLSEWKMEKGVRKLTEYQAKRFVKAVMEEKI